MNVLIFIILFYVSAIQSSTQQLTYEEMQENVVLSFVSYCNESELTNFSCYWCDKTSISSKKYRSFKLSKRNLLSIFFFSAIEEEKNRKIPKNELNFVFSFRGTQSLHHGIHSLINYILDLEFIPIHPNFPEAPKAAKVHSGFYESFKMIDKDVIETVKTQIVDSGLDLKELDKITIKLVGHSLGSTLSYLSALKIMNSKESIKKELGLKENLEINFVIFSFGSPRLGNKEFYNYFHSIISKDQIFRVVNRQDIVSSLPAQNMFGVFKFHHLATEYFFDDRFSKEFKKCDGSGEDKSCSDQFRKRNSVEDHEFYLGYSARDGC